MRLTDITGSLAIYFNWSCNALMPIISGAADHYLKQHKQTISRIACELLAPLNYEKKTLYRGIILREPVEEVSPQKYLQYLSFTYDKKIAEHFANVNGFGSDFFNVKEQLGEYGYIIEYAPEPEELLFHYKLFDILPYAEGFSTIGHNGEAEVNGLRKQKEIMIYQPAEPLTNIRKFNTIQLQEQIIL